MDKYLNQWISIIEEMRNDNTYKVMWGKAIVDVMSDTKEDVISFEQIAHKMIGYFWDLEFFFALKQAPQKEKTPIILQIVKEIITEYKTQYAVVPDFYIRVETKLRKHPMFRQWIRKTVKAMKVDVAEKFMNVNDGKEIVYTLDKQNETLAFSPYQAKVIRNHSFIIKQLLNYKLAQLLEQFNDAPRITQKVRGLSERKFRRISLKKFENILLALKPDGPILDFYTGEVLDRNDISLDHVIPWSFIYSNDLWNLVITSRSNNSKKSNRTPSKEIIDQLQERNRQLLLSNLDIKYKEELKLSIEQNYPAKFLQRMQ